MVVIFEIICLGDYWSQWKFSMLGNGVEDEQSKFILVILETMFQKFSMLADGEEELRKFMLKLETNGSVPCCQMMKKRDYILMIN